MQIFKRKRNHILKRVVSAALSGLMVLSAFSSLLMSPDNVSAAATPVTSVLQAGLNGYTNMKSAYAVQNDPTTNYNDYINIGNYQGGTSQQRFSFLQFNLSSIPQNATITSAKLELYIFSSPPGGNFNAPIAIHKVTKDWQENTLTWNNAVATPIYDSAPFSTQMTSSYALNSWSQFDLTGMAQQWVSGSAVNYGIMMRRDTSSDTTEWNKGFYHEDYDTQSLRPKLTVTYTVPATGLTVTPSQLTLIQGGSGTQLKADFTPDNATDQNVTWTSSDSSVAAVDANGYVTPGANLGNATITATTADGLTATSTVTVRAPAASDKPVTTTQVVLQQGLNGYVGTDDTSVHEYTSYPDTNWGASNLTYVGRVQAYVNDRKRALHKFDVSSIPSNAIITSATLELYLVEGVNNTVSMGAREILEPWVEGNKSGTAASAGETTWNNQPLYDAATVDIQSVSYTPNTWKTFTLTGTVRQWVEGGKPNYGVEIVDQDEATNVANYKGFASSEYSDSTKRPILRINYYIPATGVDVTPSALSLVQGGSTGQLSAAVLPSTASNKNVRWVSDTPAVATVDQNGVVTPVGPGTAIITATTDDGHYTDTSTVTVSEQDVNLSNLTLSQGALTPAFDSGTTDYSATVAHSVTSMQLTPTTSDPNATVMVNGQSVASGSASSPVSLNVGANTIKVVVTSAAGTMRKTYSVIVYRQASTDADLSNLALSQGTLSPAFSSGVTGYSATVANSITSVDVTPTAADPGATVTVNGKVVASGTPSTVPLNVGDNIIKVIVTAEDGTTQKLYTVTVTRPPSSNAELSGLSLSQGTLSPAFSSGTQSYGATVANSVTSVTMTPTLADPNATVTVNGQTVASGTASAAIPLSVGDNPINVTVTAQDGTTKKTYTVTVTRAPSNSADLTYLSVSEGSLAPAFGSGVEQYTVSVANNVTGITVTPTLADPNATVKVNGTLVASGSASPSLPLNVGDNPINVTVTAQDGTTTKTYTVTVKRAASAIASLNNLALSQGTLSPSFGSGVTSYTAAVANSVSSVSVTPTVTDGNATVKVNGTLVASGTASPSISLNVGDNPINVSVTAQDGTTTKTYTVTITRAPSNSAGLTDLALSDGTLSPAFSMGATGYTSTVANSVYSLTVTPTTADPNATVTVNGTLVNSGTASQAISLNVGDNPIAVTVTAQDGTTLMTYNVVVTRAASNSADLSYLALSEGSLNPAFASGVTSYTAAVANSVVSVKVTPTTADPNATVTVNGKLVAGGAASAPIPLNPGDNPITVTVTAQDGTTTKTYSLNVTRAAGTNADLSNLALSSGSLSPAFASGVQSYTASVANNVTSVTVTPTASDLNATLTVNGKAVASGAASAAIPLSVGDNRIDVLVTAEDGTTAKTYTVIVTRSASNSTDLSSLALSEGTLSPAFSSAVTAYSATVANEIASVTVTAAAVDPNAIITVDGTIVSSGTASPPIALKVGQNPIAVTVTAQDRATVKTYNLVVTRAASTGAELSGLTLSEGTLSPAFSSTTAEYSATVVSSVYSITVTPTAADPNASITVNGKLVASGTPSSAIALNPGDNPITVVVKAQDGTTQMTYRVTVRKEAGPNADLINLALSSGTLSPSFSSGTQTYTATVTNDVYAVSVTPTAADNGAVITVNGTIVASGTTSRPLPLNEGDNLINVAVWAQDGTSKTYSVAVYREVSSNAADLINLALSSGTLSPSFSSGMLDYTATVTHDVYAVSVTPMSADSGAVITVNGTAVASGTASKPVLLQTGDNRITVLVRTQDGSQTRSYTIIVTRETDNGADLINLTLSNGTLSPAFSGGIMNYAAAVANEVTSVTVTPTAKAGAAIKVNGQAAASGTASAPIALQVGNNPVSVEVTSPVDGVKTYTVTVIRASAASPAPSNGGGGYFYGYTGNELTAIYVNSAVLRIGEKYQLTVEGIYANGKIETITDASFESESPSIAEVDASGAVTGKAEGTTRIAVKRGTLSASATIIVMAKVPGAEDGSNGSGSGCAQTNWTDIQHHWAQKYIEAAAQKCMIQGYSNDMFMPNVEMTRLQFAVMVARALKLKGEPDSLQAFKDREQVPAWAVSELSGAVAAGVIKGYTEGTLRPNVKISRAEMITMLMRGWNNQAAANVGTSYADDSKIPNWAKGHVAEAAKKGIVQGRLNNRFDPLSTATRAEAVVVLVRMQELTQDKP
ncbi:cadherin-like beta sandwich domain-containing protein [Paenibacillus sp. sptzw28]|uniref:cadherin-like beta sandwich domain-containing protein n=1 Tax=Paenibacillus sp. sptzw28 TaxID=715179 RepID=UPI001C6E1B9C|nr:cadherin-like beta sandwich domain-containing protein [Paenibacillus sp. sptzw28]QYR21853.1 cadherin-like beta sandwich domain-containing protein [Paenibacillus sp. sptzw28]